MAYVTNEDGEVKVRDAKGISKFIPKHLAEDRQLMNTMHFEIVEAPIPFCEELKVEQMDSERLEVVVKPVIIHENGSETNADLIPVAETLTAKPKSTKKK